MEISSAMLTMLHRDFKKLYKESGKNGNELVRSLLDSCSVYNDTRHKNVLHLLWDGTWKNNGVVERFVEDFVAPLSHHIGYVCDDLTIYDRENKVFDDSVKPNGRALNSLVFESDVPIITPSFYAEDAYTELNIDHLTPVSAKIAFNRSVYTYSSD